MKVTKCGQSLRNIWTIKCFICLFTVYWASAICFVKMGDVQVSYSFTEHTGHRDIGAHPENGNEPGEGSEEQVLRS